jgi:hypothetical protein
LSAWKAIRANGHTGASIRPQREHCRLVGKPEVIHKRASRRLVVISSKPTSGAEQLPVSLLASTSLGWCCCHSKRGPSFASSGNPPSAVGDGCAASRMTRESHRGNQSDENDVKMETHVRSKNEPSGGRRLITSRKPHYYKNSNYSPSIVSIV